MNCALVEHKVLLRLVDLVAVCTHMLKTENTELVIESNTNCYDFARISCASHSARISVPLPASARREGETRTFAGFITNFYSEQSLTSNLICTTVTQRTTKSSSVCIITSIHKSSVHKPFNLRVFFLIHNTKVSLCLYSTLSACLSRHCTR